MSAYGRNATDTRVMSLIFDNSRFDNPAKNSLSIIERLKGALEASTHIRLFEEINRGVRSVTLQPLEDAISGIRVKMSALDTITDQWTRNIANSVSSLAKSITIDQLTAGWSKYEDKTQAVQTIMSATKDQWADQGQQMNYVNSQLEKLNWFTDETSYDFVDMTSNVGKFINAGVKLDDSVTAMEGISTWAARSGANVREASRAMYNLSQAMGSGKVQLVDWRSIELANMATMEFKRTVLQTGAEMGILNDLGDGLYETVDGIRITAETFRNDMSEGWFTSELLVNTLKKYGSFTDALNRSVTRLDRKVVASQMLRWIEDFKNGTWDAQAAAEEAGVSVGALTREVEELSDASYDFGREAFQAAQEAKTLSEAVAATKDAASSAWMNIYESLFGNYLDQKGLWTDVAERMYEAFVDPIYEIGDAITTAFESEAIIGEREWQLLKDNGIMSDDYIAEIIKAGKMFGYITDDMEVDADSFAKTLDKGWFTADLFDKIFEYDHGMIRFSKTTKQGITDIRDFLKLADTLRHDEVYGREPEHWEIDYKTLGYNQDYYHVFVSSIAKDYQELKSMEGDSATITDDMLKNAAAAVLSLQTGTTVTADEVDGIIEKLDKEATAYDKVAASAKGLAKTATNRDGETAVARMEGSYYWTESLSGAMDILTKSAELVQERFAEVFGKTGAGEVQDFAVDLYNLVNRVIDVIENSETLRTVLDTLFSIVKIKASLAIAKFIILRDTAMGLVDVVTSFAEGLTGEKKSIGEVAKMLGEAAANFAKWISDSNLIKNAFNVIASISGIAGLTIRSFIDSIFGLDKVDGTVDNVKNGIVGTFGDIATFMGGLSGSFKEFKDRIKALDHVSLDDLKAAFNDTVGKFVGEFDGFADIKTAFETLKTWAKDALKDVGIDLDALAETFKSTFGINTETVTAWVDGTGYVTVEKRTTFLDRLLEILHGAYEKIKAFLSNEITESLRGAWDGVVKFFEGKDLKLPSVDTSFLGQILSMLQTGLNAIIEFFGNGDITLIDWAGSALETSLLFIQDVINGFINFAAGIDWFKLAMTMGNLNLVMTMAGGIKGILDIIKMIKAPFETAADALRGVIRSFKSGQFAKNLLAIAFAIGILTASLYTITEKIDEDHLLNGVFTLLILGAALVGLSEAMSVFEIAGMKGARFGQSGAFVVIAFALKMMAKVLKQISDIPENRVLGSLGILALLTAVLLGVSEAMSALDAFAKMPGASSGQAVPFIIIAFALKMMAKVLKQISDIPENALVNSIITLAILGVVLVAMSETMSAFDAFNSMSGASFGQSGPLIVVAFALKMVAKVLKIISDIPENTLVNSIITLAILGVLLVAISEAMSAFDTFNSMSGASFGQVVPLLAVAFALKTMAKVLKQISDIPKNALANSVITLAILGVVLVAMSETMSAFDTFNSMSGASFGQVVPLLAVAFALKMMAKVLKQISDIPENALLNSIITLAILGVVLVAMSETMSAFDTFNSMSGASFGQAAPLVTVAIAMNLMARVLKSIASIPQEIMVTAVEVMIAIAVTLVIMSEVMSAFDAFAGMSGASFGQMAPFFVAALAIRAIAKVIKEIAKVEDLGKLWSAVGVVAVIGVVLTLISTIIGREKVITTPGNIGGVIAAAFAILILANAIGSLASLKTDKLMEASFALSLITGVFMVCVNTMPMAVKASAGVFAMIGAIAAIAVLLGALSRLGGDQLMQSALALAIGVGVLIGAAYAIAGLGALSGPVIAGAGVLVGLIAFVGLLGVLYDKLEFMKHDLERGKELFQTVGDALGAFVGGFIGGIAEGYARHLPEIGRFIKDFTRVTANIDSDEFDSGIEKLKAMSKTLTGVSWDTLWGGVANMLGKVVQYDELGNEIQDSEVDIWEQFGERARKIAEALTGFQSEMNKVARITIPVEEIQALGDAITSLPFNRGGFLSLFTGNDVATEEDVAAFKKVGILLADALVAFNNAIPSGMDVGRVRAANGFLTAVADLGNTMLGLWQNGWVGNQFDEKFGQFKTAIGEFGIMLAGISRQDIDVEKLNGISGTTDAISKMFTDIGSLSLPNGDISDSTRVTDLATNIATLVGSVIEYAGNEFDGVERVRDLTEKLNSIKLDGDLLNEDKVATFTESVLSISDALVDVAGAYVPESTASNFDLTGVIGEQISNAMSGIDTEGIKSQITEELGLGENGAFDINSILGDAFGLGENGKFDISGAFNDLIGDDMSGLTGADGILGELKDTVNEFTTEITGENGLSGVVTDLTDSVSGENGLNAGLKDLNNLVGGVGIDANNGMNGILGDLKTSAQDLSTELAGENGLSGIMNELTDSVSGENGLNAGFMEFRDILGGIGDGTDAEMSGLIDQVGELKNMLVADGEDGTWSITPVLDTGMWNTQLTDLKSSIMDGVSLSPDLSGMVQANIDLTPIESAIGSLQDSNAGNFGTVQSILNEVSGKLGNLAAAINGLDLILDTGALVGEITPQIDESLGLSYGRG